jgi:hypothetical protein
MFLFWLCSIEEGTTYVVGAVTLKYSTCFTPYKTPKKHVDVHTPNLTFCVSENLGLINNKHFQNTFFSHLYHNPHLVLCCFQTLKF